MDLNGDGHVDLLSGSYSGDGLKEMAGLFQVLWGQKGGTFKKAEPLKGTDGKLLIIQPEGGGGDQDTPRICTRPAAVDWDADGDLDLFVGNFEGTFYLFKGEGGGKFAPKSERVKLDNQPLKVEYHSDPFFVDWDGDGDLDLLSGNGNGKVEWAENSAGKGKPIALTKFQQLVPASKSQECWADEPPKPSSSSRVWADDLNGDGKLDLIVGDQVTIKSPVKGQSKKEAEQALAKWQEEMQQLFLAIDEAKDGEEKEAANKKMQAHWQTRAKAMKEDRTGLVWVYYRK